MSQATQPAGVASNRLLARNTIFNLVGQGAPMLVALAAIPLLIHGLGEERFGILTLAWMMIGYFSLFDLGLGRALTQLVSERLGRDRGDEIATVVWTALGAMLLLGIVGAVVLLLVSPWLVQGLLRISAPLQPESVLAFQVLALSLPFVIVTTGLRGVLEAHQRFDIINAIRVPMGVFTYVGPLLVLPFTPNLATVLAVLAVGRVVAAVAHVWVCVRALPGLDVRPVVDRGLLRPLARFGGWMTVSNIVSPLMVSLDRFVIGAAVSMAAVAYYVTPYEVVTKLWLIPSALIPVLFPEFAAGFVRDRERTARLFERGVRLLFVAIFPLTLVAFTLAREGLDLWLGEVFARESSAVLRWLVVGVFVNSLGHIPFAAVQSAGRPDLTGKLHLLELPLYALAFGLLVGPLGVVGVAIAWVLRVTIDTVMLFWIASRLLPPGARPVRQLAGLFLPSALFLLLALVPSSALTRVLFLAVALPGLALFAWYRVLHPQERDVLRTKWEIARRRIAVFTSG